MSKDVRMSEPDLAALLFKNVAVGRDSVNDLLASDKAKEWGVYLLPYKGVLEGRMETDEMEYMTLEESSVTVPDWARGRLEWVQANYPVEYIYIGEEKDDPVAPEQAAVETSAAVGMAVFLALVGAVIVAAIAAAIVAVAAAIVTVIAVGVVLTAGAAVLDPQLIIVLEDDPEKRWICIAEWLSGPSQ